MIYIYNIIISRTVLRQAYLRIAKMEKDLVGQDNSGADELENEDFDFSAIEKPTNVGGAEGFLREFGGAKGLLEEFGGEEGLLGECGLPTTPSSASPSIQSITGLKEQKKKRPSRKKQRKLLNKKRLPEEPCINPSDTTRPFGRDVKQKLTSGAYSLEGPIVPVVPVVQVDLEELEAPEALVALVAPVAPEPTVALEVPTELAEKKRGRGGILKQDTKQRKKPKVSEEPTVAPEATETTVAPVEKKLNTGTLDPATKQSETLKVSFSDVLTVVRCRPEQTIFNITDQCSHYNPYYIIQEKYGVFGKFPKNCTCFILNMIDFNCPIHNEQGLLISYLRSLYNGEIYPIFEGKPQLAASATDQILNAERVALEFYFGSKIQNETLFWQRIREIFGDSNMKLSYVFFTGEGNNVEIIQELKEITLVMIDELCGFMMIDQWCIFLHPKPRIHFHIMY